MILLTNARPTENRKWGTFVFCLNAIKEMRACRSTNKLNESVKTEAFTLKMAGNFII